MADADIRWLQRLENDERALATHERALSRNVFLPSRKRRNEETDRLGTSSILLGRAITYKT